jgi:hypothetical protein
MQVIHGLWVDGGLAVWAEDPDAAVPARSSRAVRPHPFAVPPGSLADLLTEFPLPAGDLARKAAETELTLTLPTVPGGPVASTGPVGRARPKLALWLVPALLFDPLSALEILRLVPLDYLAAVARFADDLAARGKVLPVLVPETGGSAPGGWAARWRPVLSGPDATYARDLATAMPPLLRAAAHAANHGASDAGTVLAAALDSLADAAVRCRLPEPLLPATKRRKITFAERVVLSLTGADASVEVRDGVAGGRSDEQAEAASLAAELAGWLEAARVPAGPVRTCFRLVEPPEGAEEAWTVEFALQSTADPSLMVAAADVWAGTAGTALADAPESLLAGLGRATRLFPALETALREPAPVALTLDTADALGFLRAAGPLLSGAGFGVLLPDWVRKARLGLKLTTRSRSASSAASVTASKFGMNDIVNFRYDIAVGGETLSEAELATLAAMKVPLVRLRGQWVELDERHVQAALKFLERGQSGTMTSAEALNAGLHQEAAGVPLAEVDADGWLGDLLSGEADRRLEPVPAPDGFTGTLRPYQERGLAWLSFLDRIGLGAVLADDMGLGKTVQLLSLVAASRAAGPTLLVCPMSLVGNWQREAERFVPSLRVHVYHGADRELRTGHLGQGDLVITTYQVTGRDQAALSAVDWARVVCDEAQNIKNHATRQARAVRGLPARSRIALTGTPVENRLSELWSILEFTNPGLLGSASAFRENYAIPVERHGDEIAATRLKRVTQPFVLRRLKTDKSIIADLPDKQEIKVWCNLTPEQASLYAATVEDMMARVESAEEGIERRGLVLATMAKLKQVCNHPAHLLGDGSRLPDRSGKLARLEEICDEIVQDGEKALCFTQYAEFGRLLQPHLAARLGCPVLFLHGGTSRGQRDSMVARLAEMEGPAVMVLSLKAGGTGLNLTAANHVIHFDRWWNPAVEDQATDRAFRIGQTRNVQVRKFICVGTLEERIDAMIEEKKALAERIVGTGESWLASLSVAELREVIALSPEAVSA